MQVSELNLVQELMKIIPEELKLGVQEVVQTQHLKSNAEIILALCRIITQKIDIYTKWQYNQQTKERYLLYKRKNDIDTQLEKQLMVYGAQLIYLLRSFITNEDIVFHMASKDSQGKYQADAFIPQNQVLQNLSALQNEAVGVSLALQKELIQNNQKDFMELKRENLWKRVEYLSQATYRSGRNINKIDMRSAQAKKAHWAYQSQKKDNAIYLKFSGSHVERYYDVSGAGKREGLQHFNNGWLWEWYNAILYGGSDAEYAEATASIKRGSLLPIIQNKDYTPGTKQGDFQALSGQQIQSKYSNTKIISYNNIRHIMYKLESVLTLFVAESDNITAQNKLLTILQEHFIPESANVGNAFANDMAQQLLNKFTEKTLTKQIRI